jgi:hypothetical protein
MLGMLYNEHPVYSTVQCIVLSTGYTIVKETKIRTFVKTSIVLVEFLTFD